MNAAFKGSVSSLIHPSAIVDKSAEIDPTVEIGPHVIIEGGVKIGRGTKILANAYICRNTVIGEDNSIHMGVIVGHEPQHLGYRGQPTGVIIGDKNIIREYVTIHRAYYENTNTVIGDSNFFMATSHVAHDCRVGSNVVIGNGSLLAGHTEVQDRVTISGNVAIHQFVRIGRLAMIGGLSKIVKDIPPFMMVDGQSELCGINVIGLRRNGLAAQQRDQVKSAYKIIYRSGLSVSNAVKELRSRFGDSPEINEIVLFIEGSVRGISKHSRGSAE
jgi:UDP-N-acetylglucosamine acyltransferase